jgi:photosystem II stability/assembly factor-like uncharacterized protein
MTDPFDRFRQGPATPLEPPGPGHFDAIVLRARRRRRNRLVGAGLVLAGLICATGSGLAMVHHHQGKDSLDQAGGGADHAPLAATTEADDRPTDTAPTSGQRATALPAGIRVPGGFRPVSATFVGLTGYLLGDAPCGAGRCTTVVRTLDSRSWTKIPGNLAARLPNDLDPDADLPSTVRDVRFASARDGWAFGGALFATHDGGAHWASVDVDGSVVDLATDGKRVYALVTSCASEGDDCARDPRLVSAKVTSDRFAEEGVTATGLAHAQLALAGDTVAVQVGDGPAAAVYVRNSVGHWLRRDDRCKDVEATSMLVATASEDRLFSLCGAGDPDTGLSFDVYRSDDTGRTWQRQAAGTLKATGEWLTATATSRRTVLIGTGDSDGRTGTVQVSLDSGSTWRTPSGLPAGGCRYLGANSSSKVIALPAVPTNALYVSFDGGRSFQATPVR